MQEWELERLRMMTRKNYFIYCLIKNSVVLICFTILAIYFNTWWIALLSVLFFSFISYEDKIEKEDKEDD